MKLSMTASAAVLALALAACNSGEPSDETAKGASAEATETTPTGNSDLDTLEARASYLIGYQSARQFVDQDIEIDREAFIQGFDEALALLDPRFDQQTAITTMNEFRAKLQEEALERQMAEREAFQAKAAENLSASEAFLEENKSADGIQVTDTGLQYRVVTEGEGAYPTIDDVVRVNYEGKLINGTVFDSSYERGNPTEFEVGGVISGWTEALMLMPVGSTWELFIPPGSAYGLQAPPDIGPNQALIFKVELLDIVTPEPDEEPVAQ